MTALLLPLATGLAAGATHVFSGVDHLAALLPLSMGGRWRAVRLGVRWGIGHSAGVVSIGFIALVFRGWLDIEMLSAWSERLVGVLLVAIGAVAIRHALRIQIHAHPHEHDAAAHGHLHVHPATENVARPDHATLPGLHRHTHAAFVAGTIHGVSGTAHLLGVLPAVAMANAAAGAAYLLAFAVGTILAMAAFTALAGASSARLSRSPLVLRRMIGVAGVVSILVGVFWIVAPLPA